jgi:CRISPR-associated protein Cas7/Cst2/DevR subtype I-B
MKRVLISILAKVKGNVNANGTIAALTEIKKFFTTEGETRVYVSGRCVKYCIKQRLCEKKGCELSPLERRRRVVQPKGNPISFIDDDLFGFMITEAEEVARRRFAPIKTDGIVALKHCEITRDFAGRFDPTGKEMPSPFEVEVADFIGQNNWILTENIGRFEENELINDIINASKTKLEERDENKKKVYYLFPEKRKERLKAFLEVLLKERYTFPRSATNLHQPHYFYAVILFTRRLLPLFSNIDYKIENGEVLLNTEKTENLTSLLDKTEKITIVDFERALTGKVKQKKKEEKLEIVDVSRIDNVIDEISKFLVSG